MFIELIAEYGLFLAKAITFVVAVIIVIGVIVSAGQRSPADSEGHLEVKKLNEGLDAMEDTLRSLVLDGKALKQFEKQKKKQAKSEKASKQNTESAQSGNTYVIDFDGDMKASAGKQFREVITAVLTLADKSDEVVVRPPILLVHGDADDVVPVQSLPEAADALQKAGFEDVYAHIMKGTAHGIAPDGLSVALAFMRDKLNL